MRSAGSRRRSRFKQKLDLAGQGLKTIEDEIASGDLYSWLIVTLNKFRIPLYEHGRDSKLFKGNSYGGSP